MKIRQCLMRANDSTVHACMGNQGSKSLRRGGCDQLLEDGRATVSSSALGLRNTCSAAPITSRRSTREVNLPISEA